jgi:stress-induced morphogen
VELRPLTKLCVTSYIKSAIVTDMCVRFKTQTRSKTPKHRLWATIEAHISRATRGLRPLSVRAARKYGDVLYVAVVSDRFANIRLSNRYKILNRAFEKHARQLCHDYTLVFLPWAPAELKPGAYLFDKGKFK